MKSRIMLFIAALALFMAPAAPAALAMQSTAASYPRFKLVDMGTFGGPNSFVNGTQVRDLSENGVYGGEAETNIPSPFAPYCANNDCLVQHAQAWRNGVVSDLGALPGDRLSSGVTWVGANGLMVGVSENGLLDPLGFPQMRAVAWTRDGRIINLGTMEGGDWSFATGINGQGLITGAASNTIPDPFSLFGLPNQTRTFVWKNGVKQDIGTLGGPDALMFGLNERSQISGISYTSSTPTSATGVPPLHPFLWEGGKMKDLGTLGGTSIRAYTWMNNRGQVVGGSYLKGDQTFHPFLWDNGMLKDLGTFGGTNGEAEWISDSGLVVGRADLTPGTDHHAFLWKNGSMTDLGVVRPWPCSTAISVNSRGQVVGETGICYVGGGPAFFSEGGQPMVDINTLVLPGSNPLNITVTEAFQINERGEIAGGGVLPNGDFHAVVLVPASPAEIAAANALSAASQPHFNLPSKGVIENNPMLAAPRSRMLVPFFRGLPVP